MPGTKFCPGDTQTNRTLPLPSRYSECIQGRGRERCRNKQPRTTSYFWSSQEQCLGTCKCPWDEHGDGRMAGTCPGRSIKCSKEPRVGKIHSSLEQHPTGWWNPPSSPVTQAFLSIRYFRHIPNTRAATTLSYWFAFHLKLCLLLNIYLRVKQNV